MFQRWSVDGDFPIRLTIERFPSSILIQDQIPDSFMILDTYPNPFNPELNIQFKAMDIAPIEFRAVDLLGRTVATISSETWLNGVHQIKWNPDETVSGVYFIIMDSGSNIDIRKCLYVK